MAVTPSRPQPPKFGQTALVNSRKRYQSAPIEVQPAFADKRTRHDSVHNARRSLFTGRQDTENIGQDDRFLNSRKRHHSASIEAQPTSTDKRIGHNIAAAVMGEIRERLLISVAILLKNQENYDPEIYFLLEVLPLDSSGYPISITFTNEEMKAQYLSWLCGPSSLGCMKQNGFGRLYFDGDEGSTLHLRLKITSLSSKNRNGVLYLDECGVVLNIRDENSFKQIKVAYEAFKRLEWCRNDYSCYPQQLELIKASYGLYPPTTFDIDIIPRVKQYDIFRLLFDLRQELLASIQGKLWSVQQPASDGSRDENIMCNLGNPENNYKGLLVKPISESVYKQHKDSFFHLFLRECAKKRLLCDTDGRKNTLDFHLNDERNILDSYLNDDKLIAKKTKPGMAYIPHKTEYAILKDIHTLSGRARYPFSTAPYEQLLSNQGLQHTKLYQAHRFLVFCSSVIDESIALSRFLTNNPSESHWVDSAYKLIKGIEMLFKRWLVWCKALLSSDAVDDCRPRSYAADRLSTFRPRKKRDQLSDEGCFEYYPIDDGQLQSYAAGQLLILWLRGYKWEPRFRASSLYQTREIQMIARHPGLVKSVVSYYEKYPEAFQHHEEGQKAAIEQAIRAIKGVHEEHRKNLAEMYTITKKAIIALATTGMVIPDVAQEALRLLKQEPAYQQLIFYIPELAARQRCIKALISMLEVIAESDKVNKRGVARFREDYKRQLTESLPSDATHSITLLQQCIRDTLKEGTASFTAHTVLEWLKQPEYKWVTSLPLIVEKQRKIEMLAFMDEVIDNMGFFARWSQKRAVLLYYRTLLVKDADLTMDGQQVKSILGNFLELAFTRRTRNINALPSSGQRIQQLLMEKQHSRYTSRLTLQMRELISQLNAKCDGFSQQDPQDENCKFPVFYPKVNCFFSQKKQGFNYQDDSQWTLKQIMKEARK